MLDLGAQLSFRHFQTADSFQMAKKSTKIMEELYPRGLSESEKWVMGSGANSVSNQFNFVLYKNATYDFISNA